MSILHTLIPWSEQVFVLTAAAALASLAVTHPKTRLLMWQGLLLVFLLLPAIEPRSTPPTQVVSVAVNVAVIASTPAAAPSRWHWRARGLAGIDCVGCGGEAAVDRGGISPSAQVSPDRRERYRLPCRSRRPS